MFSVLIAEASGAGLFWRMTQTTAATHSRLHAGLARAACIGTFAVLQRVGQAFTLGPCLGTLHTPASNRPYSKGTSSLGSQQACKMSSEGPRFKIGAATEHISIEQRHVACPGQRESNLSCSSSFFTVVRTWPPLLCTYSFMCSRGFNKQSLLFVVYS